MSEQIRALTFNVRHGLGLDGVQDLDRTANVLREVAPDVAGLQEVDAGAERTDFVDQAAWLAGVLGMHVVGAPARGRRPHERTVLLSRFPFVDTRSVWFRRGGLRGESRGAIVARVETHIGTMTCVAAHLSTRAWHCRRERRALSNLVAGLTGPVVLFLDANGADLSPLERCGLRPPPGEPVLTYPAAYPSQPLDWILVRPPIRHLSSARAIPSDASDHLAVLALLAG